MPKFSLLMQDDSSSPCFSSSSNSKDRNLTRCFYNSFLCYKQSIDWNKKQESSNTETYIPIQTLVWAFGTAL